MSAFNGLQRPSLDAHAAAAGAADEIPAAAALTSFAAASA